MTDARRTIETPGVGDKNNRWTFLDEKKSPRMFLCRCECGVEKEILPTSFQGKSKSCGCWNSEVSRKRATKHGFRHTRLYHVWLGMRQRCSNPKHVAYKYYGVRGISVDPVWDTFLPFRKWCLENGYVEDATYRQELDRIDNDGDYGPGNCRWVSPLRNRQNTRLTHSLTAWGETKSMSDWARDPRCRVSYFTLRSRTTRGWADKDAMETPLRTYRRSDS